MEPWQSWAIVGVAGAGAYMYYTRSRNNNRTKGHQSSSKPQAQRRASEVPEESTKRRRKVKNTPGSDLIASDAADGSSQSIAPSGKKKSKKRRGGKEVPNPAGSSASGGIDTSPAVEAPLEEPEDDGMDNKEFAKQLSSLKAGTSLSKPVSSTESKKTRKLERRNESLLAPSIEKVTKPAGSASLYEMSTTSSTTGADADDDLSPANSPALGATETAKNAGDVSDMLEAPAKGPSVLRLTQPSQPQTERQPKPSKPAPEPETKKQRQNRQKNEQKKAAREEAEKERRVLMEKQRRIAREAEGRPAKNGLAVSAPPATNAWKKPAEGQNASVESTAASDNGNGTLLDTFDEPDKSTGTIMKTEVNRTTATQKAWDRDVPSEEEQMRMLSELDDDGWNTVQKGGKAKKKKIVPTSDQAFDQEQAKTDLPDTKTNSSTNGNTNGQVKEEQTGINGIKQQPGKSSQLELLSAPWAASKRGNVDPKVWNRSNIHNHPDYDPEHPWALMGHPDDSDWAVV